MRYLNGTGLVAAALLCVMTMTATVAAQTADITDPRKPQQTFDKAWAQLEAARTAPMGPPMEAMQNRARVMTRMALDIFEGYPAEPRRWDAAVEIISAINPYVYGMNPGKAGPDAFRRDEVAKAAWNAYVKALYEQLLAQPDVSPKTVKAAITAYFNRQSMTITLAPTDMIPTVDEYARRFPDDPELAELEGLLYMSLLDANKPDVINGRLQKLLQAPNEAVRKFAEAKMLVKVGRGKPLDMKFTAVDGREVDLEKLRGKVVLIDFWATWCGPCMEEVPHLKKLSAQYQKQGFEIVGVSADEAPVGDKPESGKISARDLVAFMKDHGMSWPSHYDGKVMNNAMNVKFAVKALPTKYLLDQNGMLVAINLRGEALEAKVRELLGGNGPAQPGKAEPARSEKAEPAQSGKAEPAAGRAMPEKTTR